MLRKVHACEKGIIRFHNTKELHSLPNNIKDIIVTDINIFNDFYFILKELKLPICSRLIYKKGTNDRIATYKYNDKGLLIKFNNSDGFWITYEYNDQGLLIKFNNSNGYYRTYEYNDKGLLIKEKDSHGYYETYEYNDQGLLIKEKDSDKYCRKYEYNDQGLCIKFKNSDGYCKTFEYNELGLCTHIYNIPLDAFQKYDMNKIIFTYKEIL